MKLIIGILLSLVLLTACGQQEEAATPSTTSSTVTESTAPGIIETFRGKAIEAINSMAYEPNPIYPNGYLDNSNPGVWVTLPSGLQYKTDEYFGKNTMAQWYGGYLWLDIPNVGYSCLGFYDWGVMMNFHLYGDDTQYQWWHNFYLDTDKINYTINEQYNEFYIPFIDEWDNYLPAVPQN